jgi:hypothetical protein
MQQSYVPDGWLGIILGSKIYVDFSKNQFDECMRKLKFEIDNLVGHANGPRNVLNEGKTSKLNAGAIDCRLVEQWSKNVINHVIFRIGAKTKQKRIIKTKSNKSRNSGTSRQ